MHYENHGKKTDKEEKERLYFFEEFRKMCKKYREPHICDLIHKNCVKGQGFRAGQVQHLINAVGIPPVISPVTR